jgi:bifunctional UDP-N-acetylglucosamine pyrophosphorylase / glucosamine-1-phosphate N-acetyltransferase
MNNLDIIIMAAGKGMRMNSPLAKSLHRVGSTPTIARIFENTAQIVERPIIVIGDRGEDIVQVLGERPLYAYQREQRGTGHAVLTAKNELGQYSWSEHIMVVPGDHPLMRGETLSKLFRAHRASGTTISIATFLAPNFDGDNQSFMHYGRIRRDKRGRLISIVELKDATEQEKEIKEVNVGYYCFQTKWLWDNIGKLTAENAARELYLTDMVGIAASQKISIGSYVMNNREEALGFNTPEQLDVIRKLFLTSCNK